MLLSIIVPFHKVEKTLFRTISNISDQLEKEVELILIGDGIAKDIFIQLQDSYNHPRISIYNSAKMGANNARFMGVSKAKGLYVLFHDSDDLLPENTINFYLKIMLDKGPDVIVGNLQKILPSGESNKIYTFTRVDKVVTKQELSSNELYIFPTNIVAKAIRKECIENITFEDSSMFQDWNISAKVFHNINSLYISNKVTYQYYISEESVSSYKSNSLNKLENAENSINGIINYYSSSAANNRINNYYLQIIKVKFYYNLICRAISIGELNFAEQMRSKLKTVSYSHNTFQLLKCPKVLIMYNLISMKPIYSIFKLYMQKSIKRN
ncbi:glycosyltransferase family 2 protein [Pontibacter pudoricolor]|uniref:glycosyltransferase family 2 protein n=1 Tax=Pontibacter pudoricolor TaxID=2694930 RepID=UPI0013917A94|nr:glycosyltransferase [Pontibacter pudoricolor]